MAVNALENKRFFGIIVGGGDQDPDPEKMGRVRVAVPSIMGPNINVKDLPWCQLGSTSNDAGPLSFDRPPQEGTMVSIYYPGGSKSSMLGMVDNVYSGIPSYSDISGNVSLVNYGWLKNALNVVPKFMSGLPDIIQTIEGATIVNTNPAPSMIMKKGVPTNASKLIQSFYSEVTNIATATTVAAAAMSSLIGVLLNANTFSVKNILLVLTDEDRKEVLAKIPVEILDSFNNTLNLMGSFTPASGTNFCQTGNRFNPSTFPATVKEELLKIKTIDDLDEILFKLSTDTTLLGLDKLGTFTIKLDGPFGEVSLTVDKEGNVETDFGDFLKNTLDFLSSLTGQIESAIQMLSNSSIVDDMLTRFSAEKAATLKTGIETAATSITTVAGRARTFFGG